MMRIEPLWQDARYAVRGMRKRPRFTILAVATLALGIGVNVASLAVAYGILLRPLPYAQPSRIVILNLLFADGGDLGFSPEELQKWLPRLRTVETAAGYYTGDVTIRSGNRSTVVPAAIVTERFFDVLGTAPELGRAALPADSPGVVVGRRAIAELLGDTRVQPLGTLLSVSETGRSIVGVMPSAFAFPNDEIGVWLPSTVLKPGTKSEESGYSRIVARLKPGVTIDQLRDDANRIRRELDPSSRDMVSIVPLGESVIEGMETLLTTVAIGALLVFVVACANVATLLMGRDIARERELAARLALGASHAQLVRGMLGRDRVVCGSGSDRRHGSWSSGAEDLYIVRRGHDGGTPSRGAGCTGSSGYCRPDLARHAALWRLSRLVCGARGFQPVSARRDGLASSRLAHTRGTRGRANRSFVRAADWCRTIGPYRIGAPQPGPRIPDRGCPRGQSRAVGRRALQWSRAPSLRS
jgi:hypothetical protein